MGPWRSFKVTDMHIGKWLTAALAATTGLPNKAAPAYDFADAFVSGAPAPAPDPEPFATPAMSSTPDTAGPVRSSGLPTSPPMLSTAAPPQYDWSRPPTTRATYLNEQLADVRPVCVEGSYMDSGDCLLDVPPGERTYVRVSELMRRGCKRSVPDGLQAALSASQRDSDTLEVGFKTRFTRESQGKYSVDAIGHRLRDRIAQLPPRLREALQDGRVHIEVPRLTFQRVVRGAQEAQRNNLFLRIPDRDVAVPTGDALTGDATLGVFIRVADENGSLRTLVVSLGAQATIKRVRHDPVTYTGLHIDHLFGEIPEYYLVGRIHMQKLAAGDDLVRTLSEWLHEGHRRYWDFAYGKTREQAARNSHADVRQPSCETPTRRQSRVQDLFRRMPMG